MKGLNGGGGIDGELPSPAVGVVVNVGAVPGAEVVAVDVGVWPAGAAVSNYICSDFKFLMYTSIRP